MVQRVSGVGVTDGSSLMGLLVCACATVLLAVDGGSRLVCTGMDDCTSIVCGGIIPSMVQEGIVVAILCVQRSRRGWYRSCIISHLRKKELVIVALGLIGKGFDRRTSSSAAGKNGINLSLCGLDGSCWRVIIVAGNDAVIANSIFITIHINYYICIVVIIAFFARRRCIGIIIIIIIVVVVIITILIILIITITTSGIIIEGVVV